MGNQGMPGAGGPGRAG
jgi:26S proteasome regulatory subunit T2